MNVLTARIRALAIVFFDELWRMVPAEPLFFPFYLIGGLLALTFVPVAIPHVIFWSVMAIVSPILIGGSWWAIFYRRGFTRYLGFWTRLAGDVGQFIVLSAALFAYFSTIPIFLSIIFLALVSFKAVLVIRDVLALWVIEDVASKLHREVQKDGTAR